MGKQKGKMPGAKGLSKCVRALRCVQNVEAEIHACGAVRLWQYISLRDGSAEQPARVP